MKKQVSWTRKDAEFPAGTVAAGWSVAVTDRNSGAGQHFDVKEDATSVAFDLEAGDYTASVVRVDASGNNIGPAATADFSISAPATVMVSIPDVVTVEDAPITVQVADSVSA